MLIWTSLALAADPLVAVVLIDEAARDEGYALELEDLVVDDALPIDVAVGEHVKIVDPDGNRFEIDVAPGEAWEVTGPNAEAWMSRIGEDVRSDVLMVRGDADAVAGLARALHAEIRHEKGQTLLVGEGILFAAPWAKLAAADRLDEVSLVPIDAALAARPARPTVRAPRIVAKKPVVTVKPAVKAPEPVPTVSSVVVAPTEAPIAPVTAIAAVSPTPEVVPEVRDERSPLDPSRYFGAWLCADGNVAFLTPTGFAAAGAKGTWRVSAPGVIRLEVGGALYGRVAFGGEGEYCRAVWRR